MLGLRVHLPHQILTVPKAKKLSFKKATFLCSPDFLELPPAMFCPSRTATRSAERIRRRNLSIKGNYICREQQLLRPRKRYLCCELIRLIQAFRFDLTANPFIKVYKIWPKICQRCVQLDVYETNKPFKWFITFIYTTSHTRRARKI